ncbi:MlaC/ttg2D family ABC transporter substrate-binding protein [Celeribacter litoreus]|uniref:MlaC/ttg2D family ABC transporter substrate-binding protein n=1 Tax=Celeribacter litoreus TaxID=2876714 RepID=UPI001CCE3C2E|nr:ABC transporter substrate-binding protein [Celeribacter litoreus]MCA0042303.1 ABC transporter substrate-binding protein [Celeribacter litoreus]
MSDTILGRRTLLGMMAATATYPSVAFAFSEAEASALINNAVREITTVINSGKSESQMYREFERILVSYADMPNIARSVLGPPARTASSSQMSAFTRAFQTYIADKYGARFREFIGGEITVNSTQKINSIYEVRCTANLRGEAPFAITFIVHERSEKFIDLQIEGISLLKSERAEIGAMLDKAGGNVDQLTASLS